MNFLCNLAATPEINTNTTTLSLRDALPISAGGMGFLIAERLHGGLLHGDVMTVWSQGLDNYRQEPKLTDDGSVVWQRAAQRSHDAKVLAPLGDRKSTRLKSSH